MKKKKNFLKTMMLVIVTSLVVVIMNNCNKDNVEQATQNEAEQDMNTEDILFSKKMIWFDNSMKNYADNPNYKSGEQIQVDSAIWYLEAWLNAKFAYTDEKYTKTETKTDSLNITINLDELVEMDELATVKNQLIAGLITMYNQSSLNNKELILVDLKIVSINTTEAVVSLVPVFGEKGTLSVNYDPFSDTSWYFGDLAGDCDFNNDGTDAAQKISEAIMANKPIYLPCPGCYYIYSDVDIIIREGFEHQNSNNENLIFYIVRPDGNFIPDDKCLDPDEMNFHYHGEETIIYDILESQLNKTFMSCELEGKQDWNNSGDPRIRHHNILHFGTMHLVDPGWVIDREHLDD